jgi:hypothetical protein
MKATFQSLGWILFVATLAFMGWKYVQWKGEKLELQNRVAQSDSANAQLDSLYAVADDSVAQLLEDRVRWRQDSAALVGRARFAERQGRQIRLQRDSLRRLAPDSILEPAVVELLVAERDATEAAEAERDACEDLRANCEQRAANAELRFLVVDSVNTAHALQRQVDLALISDLNDALDVSFFEAFAKSWPQVAAGGLVATILTLLATR